MWIESIRIEGGTLDGFRQQLRQGLNVLIGGRGTGKSSVIELVRFCLEAPSSSETIAKDALEHALSVLGDGKITVTLTDGKERVEISRIATDEKDSCPLEVTRPLVFSQKEVEQIGARSQSRLSLIDGFVIERSAAIRRGPIHARIRSATSEIRNLLQEIDDVSEKLLALPKIQNTLAELQEQGAAQRARNSELDVHRKQLDQLTPLASAANVRAVSIERSARKLSDWADMLEQISARRPSIEPWPEQASTPDQLSSQRAGLDAANQKLGTAIVDYHRITAQLEALHQDAQQERARIEAQGREVRQRIEEQQKGASALDRQIAELRNTVAALLLLPADVNRSLQDKPYGAKLAKYASQHLFTASLARGTYANQPQFETFRARQQLPFRAHDAFTKADLAERRELVAKLVERIWSPDRLLAFLPEETSTPAE